jgi:hypothetical protein
MKHSDTLSEALFASRSVLRGKLLNRQRPVDGSLFGPVGVECCYCWQWDTFSDDCFDLHEIIFSRGVMKGTGDDGMLAIMDTRNCGWVHRKNCHALAEGGEGRIRAIMYLIKYEGFTHVSEYTRDMVQYTSNWFEFARDVIRAWEMMNQRLRMVPFGK